MTLFQIKHECFSGRYRQYPCYRNCLSCPYICSLSESLGNLPVTAHVQILVMFNQTGQTVQGNDSTAGAYMNIDFRGNSTSRWEKRDGKTVYTIVVPANCTAEIRLPGGRTENVKSGSFTFEEAKE